MSPTPYSNVIGRLCHFLTLLLRSEWGEAVERESNDVAELGNLGSYLVITNNNGASPIGDVASTEQIWYCEHLLLV